MNIHYLGHSSILLESEHTKILVDPFLSGNSLQKKDLSKIEVDYIVLTHGHADHVGDAIDIARNNDVPIIAVPELCHCLEKDTDYKNFIPTGLGGKGDLGEIKMKYYPAFHGTGYIDKDGEQHYAGMPASIIFTDGTHTIYHAGDTCLFGDMKLIGEEYKIDIAVLPVGDRFTMGMIDAMRAAKFLKAERVLPSHYNTFPQIAIDFEELRSEALKQDVTLLDLAINETFEL